jgi:hypothetical protein
MGHLERTKRGSGIKDRDDKSSVIEILMTDAFAQPVGSLKHFLMCVKRTPHARSVCVFVTHSPLTVDNNPEQKKGEEQGRRGLMCLLIGKLHVCLYTQLCVCM